MTDNNEIPEIEEFPNADAAPAEEPAPAPEPAPEMPVEVDPFEGLEGFDPATIVTVRYSSAEPRYVQVEEPSTVQHIMQLGQLTSNGPIDIYVEGAEATLQTVVAPGSTITLIGNVKGGN